jgi:hypothetical protein
MKRMHQSDPSLAAALRAFQTVAVTVSGLYLTTHSVMVTVTGTVASTAMACWATWLLHRRRHSTERQPAIGDREQSAISGCDGA